MYAMPHVHRQWTPLQVVTSCCLKFSICPLLACISPQCARARLGKPKQNLYLHVNTTFGMLKQPGFHITYNLVLSTKPQLAGPTIFVLLSVMHIYGLPPAELAQGQVLMSCYAIISHQEVPLECSNRTERTLWKDKTRPVTSSHSSVTTINKFAAYKLLA